MDLLYSKHKKLWVDSIQPLTPKCNIRESKVLLYIRRYERRRILLLKLNQTVTFERYQQQLIHLNRALNIQ